MRDLYSDDYESVAGDGADRLIPEGVRRLAGAAVFLGLIAAMGLWSYRLGTRDAGEVPIIRAMEGPARVEPEDPGGAAGGAPGPRGQRRARRAAGAGAARRRAPPRPAPPALAGGGRAAGRAGARGAGGAGRAGARRGRRPADAAAGGAPASSPPLAPDAELAPAAAGTPVRRDRSRAPPPPRAAAAEPAGQPRGRARQARRRSPPPPRRKPAAAAGRGAPRRRAEVSGVQPGHPARAARRLRQRGDHPQGLGAARRPERRPARRRRASTSSAPPPTRGCSTGCGSRASTTADADAADVRGAAGARHRLHPGDAAVDGGPRRHLRLRRAGARRRTSGAFFAAAEPWGFILFARNVESPAQLRRLTAELRDSVGRDAPVLIDQEGGRVARLRGAGLARVGAGARRMRSGCPTRDRRARAMYLRYRLIAGELRGVGHRRQLRAGARRGAARDARGASATAATAAIPARWRRSAGRWPRGCWPAACCR